MFYTLLPGDSVFMIIFAFQSGHRLFFLLLVQHGHFVALNHHTLFAAITRPQSGLEIVLSLVFFQSEGW